MLSTIIEIPHTLVDIYQSGALLLVRVESPIAAHSSSTGWRGVTLPGTVLVDGGTIIEILHTLVDIYQLGALLMVRVESPIAAHSSSTG